MDFYKAEKPLKGMLAVPGDKSISHRSIMFGSIARGTTHISNFLNGADCISTINCFRKMGIEIEQAGTSAVVHGKGLHGLAAPDSILDCGNSGTTMRLLSGILSGQSFSSALTGDDSLRTRPMMRVIKPLSAMNAQIRSEDGSGRAPLFIRPSRLHGITYESPVASAQVKSSVLLAGLYADSPTTVIEPYPSRDHTERMLKNFGASVRSSGNTASVEPEPDLTASDVFVPSDISSAAYFIVAALTVPGSEIRLANVGTNPTRDGILEVIRNMGGTVEYESVYDRNGEASADLIIRYQKLHGCTIEGSLIPRLIDELPVIAVLAAAAEGTTVIKDAQELKVKESNRLDIIVDALARMGADITGTDDGMIIHGGKPLHGAEIDSHLDHRIAMSFAIASLIADGKTMIKGADCVRISYPGFYEDLRKLL